MRADRQTDRQTDRHRQTTLNGNSTHLRTVFRRCGPLITRDVPNSDFYYSAKYEYEMNIRYISTNYSKVTQW